MDSYLCLNGDFYHPLLSYFLMGHILDKESQGQHEVDHIVDFFMVDGFKREFLLSRLPDNMDERTKVGRRGKMILKSLKYIQHKASYKTVISIEWDDDVKDSFKVTHNQEKDESEPD